MRWLPPRPRSRSVVGWSGSGLYARQDGIDAHGHRALSALAVTLIVRSRVRDTPSRGGGERHGEGNDSPQRQDGPIRVRPYGGEESGDDSARDVGGEVDRSRAKRGDWPLRDRPVRRNASVHDGQPHLAPMWREGPVSGQAGLAPHVARDGWTSWGKPLRPAALLTRHRGPGVPGVRSGGL